MGKEKRQKEESREKERRKSHRLYALVVLLLGNRDYRAGRSDSFLCTEDRDQRQ